MTRIRFLNDTTYQFMKEEPERTDNGFVVTNIGVVLGAELSQKQRDKVFCKKLYWT